MLHSETPMSVSKRALWVIERNLNGDLTLGDIAKACGTSKYHLAHAFGESTRISVMQYVRGRRLTMAAETLAGGAPDILALALDVGYGSHEAFTRAFRAQQKGSTVSQQTTFRAELGSNSVRFIIPLTGNMWHKP
jgi:AraC-like DNA-binding protein